MEQASDDNFINAGGGTRRTILTGSALAIAAGIAPALATPAVAAAGDAGGSATGTGDGTITTRDGTRIFYKDWGPREAQPIVFHHGWPDRKSVV